MKLRSTFAVVVLPALWAAACGKLITDEPDAASDASVSSDTGSADAPACPQYDLKTDPNHCGSCTNACAGGQTCSNGVCKSSCDKPFVQCASDAGVVCTDPTSDPNHCGTCTTACATADAGGLVPGTNNPDPGIFDAGYDGGPGWSLGTPTCNSSACGIQCPGTMSLCTDEICYDTQNHHDHCGDCATACTATSQWCTQGHCCGMGAAWCGSACASLLTDNANCGSCGHACDAGSCSNGVCAACAPSTIAGPLLTTNISGWANAGLRITALQKTTLTSFVVNNQGAADKIDLTDTTGNVLQSIALPPNDTAYTANVSWALTANTSYDLILEGGANGRWVSYSSFPQSSSGLQVVATIDQSQTLQPSYWFTFTNLTSCP